MTKTMTYDAAISLFAVEIQAMVVDHFAEHYALLTPPTITVEWGRKYARIVKNNGRSRSVHSFVDRTNGDILKAATWAAPAKHARGSVLAADRLSAVGPYGANYLR